MTPDNSEKIEIVNLNEMKNVFPEMAKTFEVENEYIYKRYGQSWGLDNSEFIVYKKDDEIISSLISLILPVYFQGVIIRVSGFAFVRTKKEYLNRGYSTKLLKWTIDYRKKRGIKAFILYTDIPEFYFRLNFEPYPDLFFMTKTNREKLVRNINGVIIRKYDNKDAFQIATLYDEMYSKYNLAIARSLNYWQWQIGWLKLHSYLRSEVKDHPEFQVAEEDGQVIGYVRSRMGKDRLEILESAHADGKSYGLQPIYHYLFERAEKMGIMDIFVYLPKDNAMIEHFEAGKWFDSGELLILNFDKKYIALKLKKKIGYISQIDHF